MNINGRERHGNRDEGDDSFDDVNNVEQFRRYVRRKVVLESSYVGA